MVDLRADDRGQFLLVGAFAIAVLLLVFAGVVNTVTYTESLATADSGPESRDVAAFQDDIRRGVDGIVTRVNNGTDDYSTKEARLTRSVGNYSSAAGRLSVAAVTGVTAELVDTDEGSRINQSSERTLTNATGASDWTLATDVPETRRFRLRLDGSSLVNGSCASTDCFTLVLNGSTTDRVSVNQSAVVVEGSTTTSCEIRNDPVTVDVTGGTVDGQACAPLRAVIDRTDPTDVQYREGDNAVGTYRLVVNKTAVDPSDYGADGPSVSPAVYAAYVRVSYRTPELVYRRVLRVAGGEPDG